MRLSFILPLFLVLLSCGENGVLVDDLLDGINDLPKISPGDTHVGSGNALFRDSLVKSVRCSDGHFDIHSQSGKNLKAGESVSIKGEINSSDPCFKKPLKFSCEATVEIGVNRLFRCNSGTVSTSFSYDQFNPTHDDTGISEVDTLNPFNPVPDSSNRQSGLGDNPYLNGARGSYALSQPSYVLTYNNGTAASVFLTYLNPDVPGFVCKHQLSCSDIE